MEPSLEASKNKTARTSDTSDVRWFRVLMGVVVIGLVGSGVTAFPLLAEVELLGRWMGLPEQGASAQGAAGWIMEVREGLRGVYGEHPWMAYGTDWLAFGHLVIALFFVGPMLWPRRDHRWTLMVGMIACVGVFPLAVSAGHVRGIPWGWRLIDCAFGVLGVLPLIWAWRIHQRVLRRATLRGPKPSASAPQPCDFLGQTPRLCLGQWIRLAGHRRRF